jgi:quercetin dioxygenase-like cupin family protein
VSHPPRVRIAGVRAHPAVGFLESVALRIQRMDGTDEFREAAYDQSSGGEMSTYFRTLGCLLAALVLACASSAQTGGLAAVRLALQDLEWTERPNDVLRAVVAGDDSEPGMYAYRFRFPSNFRVEPHTHPDDRTVVVLSGTFYVGFGDKFDESAMKALSTGSTWTEPKGQPHYAWAKSGEVVVQVVGVGPSGTTSVSPTQ